MNRTETDIRVIRTPEERFRDLPGYPFASHYLDVDGVRLHYLDEGTGETILCLHGVLEWSYTFRKAIPVLAAKHRVVVPDLVGFGRSDKFVDRKDHTLPAHAKMLERFMDDLGLDRVTLVATDWGAVVGLRLATARPERFSRLVLMNTTLPTGDTPLNFTFMLWRQFVELAWDLPIARVVSMGVGHSYRMSKAEVAAYEAPFPDARYKAATIELPLSLPMRNSDPGAAEVRRIRDAIAVWDKPALIMFSDQDPLFSRDYHFFRSLIPTAREQPDTIIQGAGHFLVEERGEDIARKVLAFMDRTPGGRS